MSDLPTVPATPAKAAPRRSGGRVRVSGTDRIFLVLMVAIPTILFVLWVWLPAIASVVLSFARWTGVGGLDTIQWIGTENYKNVFTNYPPFAPALRHNLIWLVFLFVLPTLFGMFLAVLLDRELRGTRFYQTALFLRAVLVAASWRHAGYIMLLYLAGLKGVDPSLREAAAVDGASPVRTFFSVVFPVMRPINIIILVVTVIESLRAFDIVWVINKGTNGLELISTLVTANVVGEASRIGFGSALATIMLIISLVFITIFLWTVMRGEQQ